MSTEPAGHRRGRLQPQDILSSVAKHPVEAGFLSRAARNDSRCQTPTGCIRHRCGHEMPPPGEGLRTWPGRAVRSQRRSPHCRRCVGPGVPGTGQKNTAVPSPAPSWTCWRPCCGVSRTAGRAAVSRAMRRSQPRPSVPAARAGCRLGPGQVATDEKSETRSPRCQSCWICCRWKGAIVTADALNCQRAIAAQVVKAGGRLRPGAQVPAPAKAGGNQGAAA